MMDAKLVSADSFLGGEGLSLEALNTENALHERLAALELQLKIYKQAETIGEIGNWQINLNTYQSWYSDNVFRIYGLEPNTVNSHPDTFNVFLHEADREVVLHAFEKSYAERIPLHLEFRIRRLDGQERHVNIVSSITKNVKGETLLTGITQDITNRKILEIQLRDTREKSEVQHETFRHAEQIGLFGTWKINLSTRKAEYSDNYYRVFGLKPVQLSPGVSEFLQYVHPDDQRVAEDIVRKMYEDAMPPDIQFRILRPDGKTRYVRMKSKLIKNAEGDQLVVGVIKDVTAAVNMEKQIKIMNDQLLLQHETFKYAEKTTNIGTWTWNLATAELQCSDHIYFLHGLKPQVAKATFDTFQSTFHPMDRVVLERLEKEMRNSPTELDYQYRVILPDGKIRYLKTRAQPINSPEGDIIVIGTTQDLTDDVLLNEQLKERVQFAEMLSENITDKVVITNTSNNVIGWNRNAETAFGISREEVIGKNIFDVFPKIKKPETIDRFKRVLSGESIHVLEIELVYLKGAHELQMLPVNDKNGKVMAVICMFHDISEQIELREQLRQRLQFIEKLVESSIHRISVLDRNMNYLYWNKQSEDYYELPKEKVVGKNIVDVFPSYRHDPRYPDLKKALMGETVHIRPSADVEKIEHTDEYMIPIMGKHKEVLAVLWIVHDLTDLVGMQQELKQQNALLEAVLNAPNAGVSVYKAVRNENNIIVDFSCVMSNSKSQELLQSGNVEGKLLFEFAPAAKTHLEVFRNVVESGVMDSHEERMMTGEKEKWLLHSYAKFGDGFINVWQDITEMKVADEEIRKHQALLEQAGKIAHLGSWELDVSAGNFKWSNEVYSIYGYPQQSFEPTMRFYMGTCHVEDRSILEHTLKDAKEGRSYSLIHRIHTLDGRTNYVLTVGKPLVEENGQVKRIIGTIQDITEQKLVEKELNHKTNVIRRQGLLEHQQETLRRSGSWQWNVSTDEMIWSEGMFNLFGLQPYSLVPEIDLFIGLIDARDRPYVQAELEEMRQMDMRDREVFEFRTVVNDEWRYIRCAARVMSQLDEKFVVGSMSDITSDVLLQHELKERIDLVEALTDSHVDSVIALDKEMQVIAWNLKSEHRFNLAKNEALGKSISDILPSFRENEELKSAVRSAFKGKSCFLAPNKNFNEEGFSELYLIPLERENQINGLLIIIHDVTERMENEQQLKKLNESLAEKNKRLKEMNDELSSFGNGAGYL